MEGEDKISFLNSILYNLVFVLIGFGLVKLILHFFFDYQKRKINRFLYYGLVGVAVMVSDYIGIVINMEFSYFLLGGFFGFLFILFNPDGRQKQ